MNINRIAKKITADYNLDQTPRVYVGTYAKYNDGDLTGEWVDLDNFSDYEDFIQYCKELHSDEQDPEFMFQDYENFPEKYYGESELKPELWDYIEKINDYDKQMVDAVIDYGFDLDDVDDFGYYDDCHNERSFAQSYVSEIGGVEALERSTLESYFDYESYGRDLFMENSMIPYKNGYLVRFE